MIIRIIVISLVAFAGICLIAFGLTAPAPAAELKRMHGVLCDTAAQLRTVVTSADAAAAMAAINAGQPVAACAVLSVAYELVGVAERDVRTRQGIVDLLEVRIMAVSFGPGPLSPANGLRQFVAVLVPGVRA